MDYKVAASTAVSGITVEGPILVLTSTKRLRSGGDGLCEGRFVLTVSKGF